MDLETTRLFVKVVQYGSFSKAALGLNIPKSTVSKGVARLENVTGTKLLVRTTRSLTLTAAGRVFFDSVSGPIQILEDAQKSLHGTDSLFTGLVRITAPEDLGSHVIAPTISQLATKHAGINFELRYTDDIVDLVRDGFDLAVRIGRVAESSFKVKKLGEVFLVPVASPKFVKSAGPIREPADLSNVGCLSYVAMSYATKWTLKSNNETKTVTIKSRITSNQMSSLVKCALAGGGVALVPHYLVKEEIERGKLVRLLPSWAAPGLPVSLISPHASNTSARLKISHDTIADAISTALES